jgi:non-specific serine/threonine protein kinase
VARKEGRKATNINVLEGMADLAAARGTDSLAARLWGAAEAAREATGIALPPGERALHDTYVAPARSRLGEARWEQALSEGRALSLDEATGFVLDEGTDRAEAAEGRPPAFDDPAVSLSRREREVAALVAAGLTNRQISAELSISERTAGNHVARILHKLHLHSRTQVAAWATEHRLPGPQQD